MPSSCPVCEQPIASTAVHCTVCGFPTSLAIEGLRSLDPPMGSEAEGNGAAVPIPTPGSENSSAGERAPLLPAPEAELTEAISHDLRTKVDLVRELGRGPDVTSDLCQAALSEAEGRVAEALDILRSAQSRFDVEIDQLFRQRLGQLSRRRVELQSTGVRFAVQADLRKLSETVESGNREEGVAQLIEIERRFAQFETDWKAHEGLLHQIEGLHREASELDYPLGEISGEITAIRDRLRDAELTEESLDAVAQEGAQTLVLLHEAIPASLEGELKRVAETLDELPEEYAPAAAARRLHLEAGRYLHKGRLTEAIRGVHELRRELETLVRPPAVPPPPATVEAVAVPAPTESENEMLGRLLKKARSLAGRVRTHPPESETSREAAVQIREATDLLRSRKLKEADETLSRLMRMLSAEGTVS